MTSMIFVTIKFASDLTYPKLLNNTIMKSSNASIRAMTAGEKVSDRLDYIVFILFISMAFAMILAAYFAGSHHVFMVIFFIIIVIAVILAMVMGAVWEKLTTSVLATQINTMPLTKHLMDYLGAYTTAIGLLGCFAMFLRYTNRE